MKRQQYLRRGIYIACALVAGAIGVFVTCMALSHDGKCSGVFPGLSEPQHCSLWQYLTGEGLAVALLLLLTYWPLVAVVVVLPPAVGYFLDRRETRRAESG